MNKPGTSGCLEVMKNTPFLSEIIFFTDSLETVMTGFGIWFVHGEDFK